MRRSWGERFREFYVWLERWEERLWLGAIVVVFSIGLLLTRCFWGDLRGDQDSLSTTVRNVALVIGGVIAILIAVWRSRIGERQATAAQHQVENVRRQLEIAHQQAETAQESLLNERYQKGAEMLGSDVVSVRLGGIYALQRLAYQHPNQYHFQIMRLFCSFARNPRVNEEKTVYYSVENGTTHELREDVQAVMTAIGHRSAAGLDLEELEENFQLDLRYADLHGASLEGANLAGALLTRAELGRTDLRKVNLSGSSLLGAKLDFALLKDAKFSGADLLGAKLCWADIENTDFSLAHFYSVNLSGTHFKSVQVSPFEHDVSETSLTRVTQSQLDQARADPNCPPKLEGIVDAETGETLVWRGQPLDTSH